MATSDGARLSYSGTGDEPASDGTFRYARGPAEELLAYGQGSGGQVALADKHGDQVGGFVPGAALSGLDDSAAYDPFGRVTASRGGVPPVGFQGDWTDPGTGHVDMGARWYDPQTGTFDSRDDLTLDPLPDSVAGNRYTYADAGPLDAADPSGHCSTRTGWTSDCWSAFLEMLRTCQNLTPLGQLYKIYYLMGGSAYFWMPPPWVWFGGGSGGSGGSGGGSGGSGGSGYNGPTPAQQAAAARARAIAAARARTAAAKRRAEQDAKKNVRKIKEGLRRPRYADPKQRISDGIRRPATVTDGTNDVVGDTTRSLWRMHDRAVRDAGPVIHPTTPAALAPPEALPVNVPDAAGAPATEPVKVVKAPTPEPATDALGGGAQPPGSLRVAGDMCDEDEILTSVGCESPLDTLKRVVNNLRDHFTKNPDDMRRYLSQPEMDAALNPKGGFLGRINVGKAVERAAANHPDINQHFFTVTGKDMPDFVAIRTLRMYEVTTNTPSAFFSHVNRGYVDPTQYVPYGQVPFGTGLLPRLPQPGMVEPKFPFPKAGP
ncbi:RHS repeat-associated core domain-containing protein [Nonomuraea sp. NPDC049269]|uniref:RHS repeat-associated core domain-containing protein n=1 Tax=Nonomuraea sp. NPDC049269 TaxID=3364349 RepID=UPI00371C9275